MSRTKICEANLTMEIAQLLLSLLHAWGLDPDLDKVCEGKLGLLRPMVPVSFGVVSKAGEFTLVFLSFFYSLVCTKCYLAGRL
jgi:hypothetical protein